ncbi:hypothetical protein GCM10009760_12610 [Kitasatospora kazusensis]|uniref:Uncharacterized protein n=1 Tax=Kitasatospora kazusensis TaxID=407974 RepID=A0ABP5KTH3_9ACTN
MCLYAYGHGGEQPERQPQDVHHAVAHRPGLRSLPPIIGRPARGAGRAAPECHPFGSLGGCGGVRSGLARFPAQGGARQAWVPPSMRISVPVTNAPSSEASIATTPATASGPAKP